MPSSGFRKWNRQRNGECVSWPTGSLCVWSRENERRKGLQQEVRGSGWCLDEIKTANLDKRHEWRGDHRIFSVQHSSHMAADLILFSLPRNLKRSGIQICLLMLIFGLSFPPFVNGDQRGRRRQEREGDVRPRPTACLVPKTCRHPLLSARLRKGKMDMDHKNVHH